MAACEDVEEVRRIVNIAQAMINLAINQLDTLRTRCAVTEEVTQQQIRKLEEKLITFYSQQLAAKVKLPNPLPPDMIIQYPSLRQWLQVVGLTENSIQMICSKVNTLEALKEKSELELNSMLDENCIYYKEECRRLCKALDNLWRYTDILIKGGTEKDSNLYWDSWDSHHLCKKSCEENPKPNLSPTARCSIPSESSIPYHNNNGVLSPASSSLVSNSSLSLSPCISLSKQEHEVKARKTPPPFRKHLIKVQNNPIRFETFLENKLKLNHESKVVTKSHFELNNDDNDDDNDNDNTSSSFRSDSSIEKKSDSPVRRDLPIEQSLDCGTIDSEKEESLLSNSSSIKSPVKSSIESPIESSIESPIESPTESLIESPIELLMKSPVTLSVKSSVKSFFKPPPICTTNVESDDNNLEKTGRSFQVPKSPFTSDAIYGMSHTIGHRFAKSFNVMTVCDYCLKPMFMNILKCRECKYRCHRECRIKVPPSCGLPRGFIAAFKRSVQMCAENSQVSQLSPILMKTNDESPPNNHVQLPSSNRKDRRQSYTQTSTNTSSQGESNLNTFSKNRSTPSSPALPSTISHSTHSFLKQFHFPDVLTKKETLSEKLHEKRYKSESAISKRRKSDVDSKYKNRILSTLRYKTSDLMVPKRTNSQESSSDSEIENICCSPPQDSILMKEWNIAYNELKIKDMIGKGRFSTVYRGYWHGNIAIKFLNMNYHSKDEKTLETFKLEVATYQKSEHNNIIFFKGVCMKPPQLALVTDLTRGLSLHYCLHIRKDRYTLGEINSIAQQICEGMIYLHSRNIIHKDLRSKNVFVENGKVMISDFGLFNITKLCHGNRKGEPLNIPPGWLCYLAPEIIRRLRPLNRGQDKLPYTFDSDVYAFGTIWYELLCGEWPFRGQPIETIIWQVGKGMKQSLSNLQASRDVKDILMYCWSYYECRRLDFIRLTTLLKKLPRKTLARSSSNPTNSARPAESMF